MREQFSSVCYFLTRAAESISDPTRKVSTLEKSPTCKKPKRVAILYTFLPVNKFHEKTKTNNELIKLSSIVCVAKKPDILHFVPLLNTFMNHTVALGDMYLHCNEQGPLHTQRPAVLNTD